MNVNIKEEEGLLVDHTVDMDVPTPVPTPGPIPVIDMVVVTVQVETMAEVVDIEVEVDHTVVVAEVEEVEAITLLGAILLEAILKQVRVGVEVGRLVNHLVGIRNITIILIIIVLIRGTGLVIVSHKTVTIHLKTEIIHHDSFISNTYIIYIYLYIYIYNNNINNNNINNNKNNIIII